MFAIVTACNSNGCGTGQDSNSSAIYESALGLRRQYSATTSITVDDQESLQVNVADGNLVLQANDFSLPGIAGFGYQLTRTYNSLNNTGLSLGSDLSTLSNPTLSVGWEDVPDIALFSNGDARYTGDGGYEITFIWHSSTSSFTAPPGSDVTLSVSGGVYSLKFDQTGVLEKFNSSGQLTDEYDRNNNHIVFSWASGKLSTVTDTTGRVTTFNYTSGKMTSITAPCSFANLLGIASTGGSGTLSTGKYYYQVTAIVGGSESPVTSEISEAVTGPTGKVALTWHAVAGATGYRVYRGTTSGGENTYYPASSPSYTDTGATGTSGSPPASSGTCTYAYTYDGSGRLATYTDPLGATTTYSYNSSGLLSTVKNARTYEWSIVYNSQNRVSSITGGLNSSGGCPGTCPVTSFTYTGAPTTLCTSGMETDVTDPSSYVTMYCTDGRARASEIQDPLGNMTLTDYSGALGGSNCVASGETLDDQPCATEDGLGYITQYGYDSSTGKNRVWEQNPLQLSTLRSTWSYTNASFPFLPTTFTDANGHQTKYTYDSNGNPASTTQGLDSSGTCTATLCPRTDYIYASNGELQATKLGLNSSGTCATGTACSRTDNTYFTSNSLSGTVGDLASATTGLTLSDTCTATCPETTYTYDGAGNQTSQVDPLGNVSGGTPANYTQNSVYDSDGRLLALQDELDNTTSYTYDSAGNQVTSTNPNGDQTSDSYDANNRQLSETAGWQYDSGTGVYDCLTGTTCPTTDYGYLANGDIKTTTDPNGNVTTDCYNGNHELMAEYSPLAGSVTCPLSVTCSTASNYETQYCYDADGNQTAVLDPLGNKTVDSYSDGTTGAYASVGELISQQTGLTSSGTCPTGPCPKTTYSYDLVGNKSTVLDPLGNQTDYSYDPENRVFNEVSGLQYDAHLLDYVCITGDTCPSTNYTYDAEGNKATVQNARLYETKYTYDFSGHEVSQQPGLNSSGTCNSGDTCPTTSFTYDADGNLATKTVPAAPTEPITYNYDNAGELTSTIYATSPVDYSSANAYYTYDGDGSQTSVATGAETTTGVCSSAPLCQTSTFDNNDQLTVETTNDSSGSKSFAYAYDPNGNITTDQYPDGTYVYSAYNADDQLCLVEEYTGTLPYTPPSSCSSTPTGYSYTKYAYDHADNLQTTAPINTSGSTVQTETPTYDSAGFPSDVLTKTSTGGTGSGTIADMSYTLNNAGMPTTITRNGTLNTGTGSNSYPIQCTIDDSYDNNEHITSAYWHTNTNCPNSNVTYSYSWDPNGNRTQKVERGTTTTYAYNNLDELCNKYSGTGASCTSPPAGSTSLTFDGDGNETFDGTNYYVYNLADQLCLVSTTANQTCTSTPTGYTAYSYDGSGSIYATTTAAGTVRSLYDPNGNQLADEWTGSLTSGSLLHRYVYGLSRISETHSGQDFYYTRDSLNSELDLVNASGVSQRAYVYNTFGPTAGTPEQASGAPANDQQFIGQRLDTAPSGNNNFYDTTIRNLDTTTGRFLTQDPAAVPGQTAGTYTYANDNPDTYADPTGEISFGPDQIHHSHKHLSFRVYLAGIYASDFPYSKHPLWWVSIFAPICGFRQPNYCASFQPYFWVGGSKDFMKIDKYETVNYSPRYRITIPSQYDVYDILVQIFAEGTYRTVWSNWATFNGFGREFKQGKVTCDLNCGPFHPHGVGDGKGGE